MKKKLLLTCCTVALALSACGGGNSSNTTEANNIETVEGKPEETGTGTESETTVSSTQNGGKDTTYEVTEEDVLGRWIVPDTRDLIEFDKGHIEFTWFSNYCYSGKGGASIRLQGNKVEVPMELSIDSDCWYQFENDGEHKRLVGETGDIIPEDDYFASLERFSLGDTISTDITELVVNSVDFTDGDQIKTFIESHHAKGIESDQAFVHVNFEVTNNAKQELPLPERSCFTLDYKDGFRFSTDSDKDSVFYKPSTKESCLVHNGGGSNWPMASLAPLETETFDLFIPCAEKVATDPDASYVLYIVLPEENGIHEYAVTVK